MQTLNQDLKEGSFRPVYLLYGEETFLVNSYKNRLKEAILGDDTMNFSYYEGKGIDVNEVIRQADTMPFFAEKRLILVENSGFFKTSSEALASYLPEMPETSCMIFVETQVDKRNKLYKKVKDLGYAAELGRQNSSQLARWAGGILAREGKKITGKTMELFLSMAGDDMENIRMELEKIVSYTMGREVVTDKDVKEICTVQVTNRIFDMVAAIVNGQTKKAMDLYEDLLTLKEPPMRILFLIARQFNQLLQVKELMAKGFDKGVIASKMKIQPFVVGKIMTQARLFSRDEILECVRFCVELEEAVKSGQLQDSLAVELLITRKK